MNIVEPHPFHLGRLFGKFTKQYIGFITKYLESLPIERYYYVLLIVHKAENQLTQNQLSELLETDKASTVRIIDYLQKKNMLKRSVNPNDRREHFVLLTESAEKYLPLIEKGFETVNELILNGMSDNEKNSFYSIVNKMIDNLSTEPKDPIF